MSDTLGLLIPICALSLVCVGLLGVVAFILVRFVGIAMPGWLGNLNEYLGGKTNDTTIVPQTARRRTSLRDQAVDLDFDAAVARHQLDKKSPRSPGTTPSAGAQSAGGLTDFPNPSLRRRRKRPRDGYSDDEIHGGILDEDGDGDLDF